MKAAIAFPAFVVLGVLALVSAAGRGIGRGARASEARAIAEDPRWVRIREVVARSRAGVASPEDLLEAADLAQSLQAVELAQRLTRLALSLTSPADDVDDVVDVDVAPAANEASPFADPESAPAPSSPAPAPATAPSSPASTSAGPGRSPVPEASDAAWRRFVGVIGDGKSNSVTPNYHLGIFRQGARKLADLGVMTNVRRGRPPAIGDYAGDRDVWVGEWVAPYSLERFLSDPALQYQLFARDVAKLRAVVLQRHRAVLGQTRAGHVATLSGLIAVALRAGTRGLAEWLKNTPTNNTTRAFVEATGLF